METEDGDQAVGSPGWEAINRALAPLYAGQEPRHYGTLISYRLGGPDPLDGISAYWRDAPRPHWHFITFGFSDLYAKESDEPAVSGYGFELTFRLAASPGGDTPPMWALNFLQNLARYVFETGNAFEAGHYLNLNGPIALDEETDIRAIAFTVDPELGEIDTPHGQLTFLQVVGLTLDEELAIKGWHARGFFEIARQHLPLLITDLTRRSLLTIPAVATAVEQGTAAEGSSTGSLFVSHSSWQVHDDQRVEITLGARAVIDLKAVLPGRIGHGRPLALISQNAAIAFEPGAGPAWHTDDDVLHLQLTPALAHELADTLQPQAGVYSLPALTGIVVNVVPSVITDADGNVVETVG